MTKVKTKNKAPQAKVQAKAESKMSANGQTPALANGNGTNGGNGANGVKSPPAPGAIAKTQIKALPSAKTSKTKLVTKPVGPSNPVIGAKGSPILGSVQSPLRIFQIYYEPWQRDLLDPQFAAIDNGEQNSEMAEFLILERLAKSDYVKGAKLWGALSWRFTERTGMTSADWVKAIEANRGNDVYYCDPSPLNEALFHNLWLQGETVHPQFLGLCLAFFKATGLPEEELTTILPPDKFTSSNYFVGSPQFWELYLPWISQLLATANKKLPPKVRDLLHAKMADGPHKGLTYVPFILERLFPIFMKTAGKKLHYQKIALPALDNQLNVHLRLLREVKNLAHSTKSPWMAAVWVNYRNLYLMQTNGKDWCAKYLRNITPTDIKFA